MKKLFKNTILLLCLFSFILPEAFAQIGEGGNGEEPESAPCTPIEGRDINNNIYLCKDYKNFYVGVDQNVLTPLGHKFYVGGNSMLNGRVGIGISSVNTPYQLDVAGDMNLLSGNAPYGKALHVKNAEALAFVLNSSGERYFSWGYGANFNYFKRNIVVGGSEVNVTQSAPLAKIDIRDGGTSAGSPFLRIGDDVFLTDIDYSNTLGIFGKQNNAIGKVKLGNSGPTLIGQSKSLGINVDPLDRLHVKGGLRTESYNNSNSYIKVRHDNANGVIDSYGNGKLLINYYTEKGVTIGNPSTAAQSGLNVYGRVGVGVNATEALDVKGNGKIRDNLIVDKATTTKDLEATNKVAFTGLATSTSDLSVLVSDAGGSIKKRTLPASAWSGGSPQTLSLSGNDLSISQGNTITLPTGGADNLGNHVATSTLDMDLYDIEEVGRIKFVGFGSSNIEVFSQNLILNSGTGQTGVGINKIPASGFALDVNGDIQCVALTQTSDRRVKKDIKEIDSPLQKILNLNGVAYKFIKTNKADIGFLAQEMLDVLPELVYGSEEGQYSIRYSGVIPVLVEAFKEQQTIIDDQNNQISNLEDRLLKLEQLLASSTDNNVQREELKLEEKISLQSLDLSPNPAKDEIFVKGMKDVSVLTIFSLAGVKIKTIQALGTKEQTLDITELSSGMYLLTAVNAKGQIIATNQFVKE